jgi:ArsR family transcriptional regulator, virulence genes transcriptional regulator
MASIPIDVAAAGAAGKARDGDHPAVHGSSDDGSVRRRLFALQAQLCAALADPTRLEILDLLRDGERTVGELMEALAQRQNNVSQHLAYLRRVGAVSSRRHGTFVYYRLAMPGLTDACDAVREALLQQLAAQAGEAAALSRALEEGK